MSAETTLEESQVPTLIRLRGYKLIDREEKKEIISFTVKMPQENKTLVIWCIPIQGAVGVRYVDQLEKAVKAAGAEGGIIVTQGRYTPAAKKKAKEKEIELIPNTFPSFNIFKHILVPKHETLTQEEKTEMLAKYRVQPYQLPWIKASDPAAIAIGARPGDILRVTRDSPTAGKVISFRYVIEG